MLSDKQKMVQPPKRLRTNPPQTSMRRKTQTAPLWDEQEQMTVKLSVHETREVRGRTGT